MMRPMYVQLTTTIATITVDRPGLMSPPAQPLPSEQDDAIPSARRRIGKASVTSMTREMTVSVAPRWKPARSPATTPSPTDRNVATSATWSETRAP